MDQQGRADFSVVRRASFLPSGEYPLFISLPVANRGHVSASEWQKLIPMVLTGKSRSQLGAHRKRAVLNAISSTIIPTRSAYELLLYRLGSSSRNHLAELSDDCRRSCSPASIPHPAGGLPYPVGAYRFSILSLYRLYLSIQLATRTRMTMFLRNSVRSLDEGEDPIFNPAIPPFVRISPLHRQFVYPAS